MDRVTDVPTEVWEIINKKDLKFDVESPNFTANLVCELAKKVHEMITFTFDTPHMNADKKLPILDVKVHLKSKSNLFWLAQLCLGHKNAQFTLKNF